MRKLAIVLAVCIIYLSNVPGLMVSDPSTWFNKPIYTDWTILKELKSGGIFYLPWTEFHYLEFYLHKLGHFVFYGLLTVFVFWKTTNLKTFIGKLFLIISFAVVDELHQLFVIGRSGRLMDVLFDTFSILVVLLIMLLLGYVWAEKEKKK